MCSFVLPLLMLAAVCYGAPANLLDIGGTLGYDSQMNGTIGGHVKAERDGLSVNGTGRAEIGASWAPTLIAKGHAGVGDKMIAADASLKTVIDNSWQPSLQGELGRNSKGEWLAGAQPHSILNNKLVVTPGLKLKTGEEAKQLIASS